MVPIVPATTPAQMPETTHPIGEVTLTVLGSDSLPFLTHRISLAAAALMAPGKPRTIAALRIFLHCRPVRPAEGSKHVDGDEEDERVADYGEPPGKVWTATFPAVQTGAPAKARAAPTPNSITGG